MALTQNQIWEAADKLEERGESPTLAAVRRELSGGSYTTISEAMQQWRSKKQRVATMSQAPIPEAIVHQSQELIAELWQTAKGISDKRLETERKTLDVAREQMESENREAAQIADQLSSELEKTKADLVNERKQKNSLETELAKLVAQAEATKGQIEELKTRLEYVEKERETANLELQKMLTKSGEADGMLKSEIERRKSAEVRLTAVTEIQSQQVQAFIDKVEKTSK